MPRDFDEIGKLARIEEEADRRYLETRFHAFADTSGIPADVARRYIAEDRLLVAVVNEEPIAFIGWSTEDDRTVLGVSQISVLTEFGRQGIGTRLLNTVLDRACRGLSISRAGHSDRGAMERALVSAAGV